MRCSLSAAKLSLRPATSYYGSEVWSISPISIRFQTSAQAWKLLEQDYTLRLSLVSTEWAKEHLQSWNAVFAEGRKRNNAGYFSPALVEMEIADLDKRAAWCLQTCCEIWEMQGRGKSRPLFRAIFDFCLQPMFSVREGSFIGELQLHERRTGAGFPQGLSGTIRHLKRQTEHLRAEWNTKLEIATRDSDYEQQRNRVKQQRPVTLASPALTSTEQLSKAQQKAGARIAPQPSGESLSPVQARIAALSFDWRELETRFQRIQAKPAAQDRVIADFTRTEWESGSVTEEWTIQGSPVFKAEFEQFASIAARKLGYTGNSDAVKYWLERVREWLHRTGLDKEKDLTWRTSGEGHIEGRRLRDTNMSTQRIAEMSAMFCIELLTHGTPESFLVTHIEQSKAPSLQSRPTKLPASKITKHSAKRRVIFGAIQSGLKALKYCTVLDDRRVRLPGEWIDEGCPATYAQAYKDERWRKRIQDEKCRHRKQYEKLSALEREALIQRVQATRHTRS